MGLHRCSSWFEVFFRFGFDLLEGGVTRFGIGMEVSPANTDLLLGGAFYLGDDSKSMPLFDATFDVGYGFGLNAVKPVAVPVFVKIGLVDSSGCAFAARMLFRPGSNHSIQFLVAE